MNDKVAEAYLELRRCMGEFHTAPTSHNGLKMDAAKRIYDEAIRVVERAAASEQVRGLREALCEISLICHADSGLEGADAADRAMMIACDALAEPEGSAPTSEGVQQMVRNVNTKMQRRATEGGAIR